MKIVELTKETLSDLYINKNKTDKEIGEIYIVPFWKIRSLRNKFGIKGINARHRILIDNPLIAITPRQNSIILGSLLGDGCLKPSGKNKSYLSISHSIKQKGYIEWLYRELASLCVSEPKEYTSKGKYITYTLSTQSREELKKLRDTIYVPHKKVNQKWVDQIDPLGITIWYMDDGSLQYVNKSKSIFSFATNSFSIEEHYLLIDLFKKFSIQSEIKTLEKKTGIQYNLLISDCSYRDFIDLVSPYIVSSMKYKLPNIEWEDKLKYNIETKISKERLEDLYCNQRLTQEQIASMFSVHKSTIRKYMNLFDIDVRNYSNVQQNGINNKNKRDSDTGQFLETSLLLNPQQETKSQKLFKELRNDGFPYIPKKHIENYIGILDSLCKTNYLKDDDGYFKYSSAGLGICSAHCSQVFSMSSNGSISPIKIFNDDKMLMDCIRRTIKFAKKDTISAVRQGLKTYKKNRCVTIFPPVWAKMALIELMADCKNLSVLDFSCGFGGRLVGSYASNIVSRYTGIDPILRNIKSHNEIYDLIIKHANLSSRTFNANFVHGTAENYLKTTSEKFDIIMTSPPYFNKEIYSQDKSQCYNNYSDYKEWIDNWFSVVLRRSYEILNDGGMMIIFASDIYKYPVGTDCKKIMANISGKDVNVLPFKVISLEYFRSKSMQKIDTAWFVSK